MPTQHLFQFRQYEITFPAWPIQQPPLRHTVYIHALTGIYMYVCYTCAAKQLV